MKKILIADTDPQTLSALRLRLEEDPDFQVKETLCGIDAWKILTTFKDGFDAAIMELSFEDIEGLELLRRIRGKPALQSLPIVLHTSIHDRTTVIASFGLGIRHYVVKPAPLDDVYSRVKSVIAAPQASTSGSAR